MGIRAVDKIPKPAHVQRAQPFEYTERIMNDIAEAYDSHIPMFEFIGYDSPNYVTTYAKEIALKFIKQKVYSPALGKIKVRVEKTFKRKLGKAVDYMRIVNPMTADPAIKIIGVTVNGEKRVYGKIDFDYIANYEDIMVNRYIDHFSKPEVQSDLIRMREREKQKEELRRLREANRGRQN